MAVESVRARDFWQQLENHQKNGSDEPDYFKRGSSFRSSYNSGGTSSSGKSASDGTLHGPVWGSIYCTMRDRSRGRGIRSSSATSQRGVIRTVIPVAHRSTSSTSINQQSTQSSRQTQKPIKMADNNVVLTTARTEPGYIAPKRYETTCYFMPLAVPVWYSTSVSIKINSTKRTYRESVNYQKKLVPYRYIESMTTKTPSTPEPVMFLSDLNIQREIPAEHYMSLEPQQEAALNKPFSSSHQINIESNT
ncbi:hypothetical protein CBL_00390 [Carabus blaptoides fortunei]